MNTSIQHIAVITSGGDAPGMNAAIRAVARTASYHGLKVSGYYRGYDGLMEGDSVGMTARSVKNTLAMGGTWLKSARSEAFRTVQGRAIAAKTLESDGVDALVVIGGDGSFRGAQALSEEHGIPVIGIPGTIDNDLYGTDHSIGFDTAVNTVMHAVDKIRDTANSHNRFFLVEVMGRDSGFIALSAAIATGGMDAILPEVEYSVDELFETVRQGAKHKKTSNIVIVAEGSTIGSPAELAQALVTEFPELDVKVSTLGHMQRGGSPSHLDRILAGRLGVGAVDGLLQGKNQVMVGLQQGQLNYVPFDKACSQGKDLNLDLLRVADILSI